MTMTASRKGLLLNVDADSPDAWKAEPYYSTLKNLASGVRQGAYVAVSVGQAVYIVFPEEDLEICQLAPGSKVAVSYREDAGTRQPYAAVQAADCAIREFFGGIYQN